jgi:uncharacterized protein
VLLEDTDPLRSGYGGLCVTDRLSGDDADDWVRSLDATMAGLRSDAPDYLDGIAATVRAVVPVRAGEHGEQRSGSARTAFGAVAMSLEDPVASAMLLIHEVQHLKLGALLDVCAMFDGRDERRLSVPWRTDPRPIEGVLQGAYAFLALADVWRRRPGAEARERYRTIRGWTDRAVDELLGVRDGRPFLNPAGTRFAGGMRAALDRW